MKINGSEKMKRMTSSIFQEVVERKHAALANGKDVIDLSIGSPDFPPPQFVIDTLVEHSKNPGNYFYTLRGIEAFNEAVAHFYYERYDAEIDSKREVLQLMGSQDGLAHLATAIVNPGDYVLVPDPGYPIYEASVTIAGGKIHPMPLLAENKFLPKLEDIPSEVLQRTKMMILSYPGNPVTALADRAFFEEVIVFAKIHNIIVVHDFAYSELIYDSNPQISFMSVPGAKEVGVEFNSLSKTFNMAGCRIGYMVGNTEVIDLLSSFKSHIDYGVFYPIQMAAVAALTSDYSFLEDQVRQYELRRNALVTGLRNSGWAVANSPATMFVWAKIPAGWKSRDFAFQLIDEEGIVVVPGDAFGKQGEGYVRIALVQPPERLEEAAQRVNQFLLEFSV
ncbi:LL-diaminopimelate aminotransferase [Bacillus sp. REN3]|uniref:LL-diaminopimelate aminotransferase n=1 Tax=Bacillus sp. REN3 TaxID=2802440 RepID=UPI001AEDA678|nr:LL-diaminopimelate aminotransferase [Bacillus sp. REN3]